MRGETNEYTETLETLHQVEVTAYAYAKELGLTAVEHGYMTRKETARILGVHPVTISRWLTAREAEVETPDES